MSNKTKAGRHKNWWSEEEHNLFVSLIPQLQRKWMKYTEFLPNRTVIQIRSHAQKYFIALGKDSNYKMYSGTKKKGKERSHSTSTAYLPIMKKYLNEAKQQDVKSKKRPLRIDIDAASKVEENFKRKRVSENSSDFTFDDMDDDSDTFSNLSDLTYDSSFATIVSNQEDDELQFELEDLADPNINEDNFFRDLDNLMQYFEERNY